MSLDCFKGASPKIKKAFESRITEGMSEVEMREVGVSLVTELFNDLDARNVKFRRSLGNKKIKKNPVTLEQNEEVKQKSDTKPVRKSSEESSKKSRKAKKKEQPREIRRGDDLILRHGSPHVFTKFDSDKIGTGEGNQSFGFGLYFTESEAIAKRYASKLSDNRSGILYEVTIKNGAKNKWLDWRGAIEEGYESSLEKSIPSSEYKKYEDHINTVDQEQTYTGALELYLGRGELDPRPVQAGALYQDLADALGPKRASDIMTEIGFDGVVYRSSAGLGKANNYVVFNDDSVSIEKITPQKKKADRSKKRQKAKRISMRGRTPMDKRKIQDPAMLQALQIQPTDAFTLVKQYFIGGGRMTMAGMKEVIASGQKNAHISEGRLRISYMGSKAKGGKSFNEIVHSISQSQTAENLNITDQDIRNAMIDVIGSHLSPKSMAKSIAEGASPEVQVNESGDRVYDTEYGKMTDADLEELARYEAANQELDQEGYSLDEKIAIYDILGGMTDEEIMRLADERELSFEQWVSELTADNPAKLIENAPEIKEVDKQIEDARKEIKSAQDALKAKQKSLDQKIVDDQQDLFGKRKSTREQGPALFEERVDMNKRSDALKPELARLEKAEKNLRDLLKTRERLAGTQEVTPDLDFENQNDPGFLDKLETKLDEWDKGLQQFGRETLGVNLPIAVARTAVIAMKAAVKTAKTAGDVLDAGWNAIKGTKWYQRLKGSEKNDLEVRGLVSILSDAFAAHNAITEDQAKAMVDDAYAGYKKALENKPKNFKEVKRKAIRAAIKAVSDRQFLSKKLVDKIGAQATKDLMINSHGSSGKAKRWFDKSYDKIFRGLTTKQRETLDIIINLRRIIAIDRNRHEKNLSQILHPGMVDPETGEIRHLDGDTALKALNAIQEEIGEKKMKDMIARADAYFKVYSDVLKAVYKNGLISEDVYESLNGLDYQPRLFLQHITDYEGNINLGAAETQKSDTGGLSQEQIRSLDEGSMQKYIMDAEWLLATSLVARTKSIAMNNINRQFITKDYPAAQERYAELKKDIKNQKNWKREYRRFYEYFTELSSKIIDNPIVGSKKVKPDPADPTALPEFADGKTGLVTKPVYKYKKAPDERFKKAYYYVDGVRNEFFIEEKLHDSWFDNSKGLISRELREILSYVSGSALLKAIATGNNPTFAVVNAPRDYLFTAVFSPQYSTFLPKAIFQVGVEAFKGGLSIKRSGKGDVNNLFEKYIEYGGDMAFLSTQGRLKKNTMLGKVIDKAIGRRTKDIGKNVFSKVTLSAISTYSEIVFRLALFQRTIKNELKARGFDSLEDIKDQAIVDEIYNRGVAEARSLLDFNQGGILSKDIESLIPYFNTAVQGSRVAMDMLQKDPMATTIRMFQAGALLSGLTIAASFLTIAGLKDPEDENNVWDIWFESMEGISRYQKMMYFNFPTGRRNKDGQYHVVRIAKNHQLTFIFSFTDGLSYNLLAEMAGKEKMTSGEIWDDVKNALASNISPVDVPTELSVDATVRAGAKNLTRNPFAKSILTYATGYDFYRDQPLARNVNDAPLALEGQNLSNIEDFYKKLGREHGMSPARTKAMVEAFITQPTTNPGIGIMYGFADAVSSDDTTLESLGKDIGKSIAKSFVNRASTYTSDFNRSLHRSRKWTAEEEKLKVKEGFDKIDRKDLVKRYVRGDISLQDLVQESKKFEPRQRKKIQADVKNYTRLSKVVDREIIDIKYAGSAKLRALMILNRYGDIFDGSPENRTIRKQMKIAGGILTNSVMQEYQELKRQVEKSNSN